jgi:glutamate-1-semialdehyde aminotransferase
MVFSRFFKGQSAPESSPPAPPDDDEPGETPEGSPEEIAELTWAERADKLLPTGASTGSKRSAVLYGDEPSSGESRPGPTHFTSATGCHVVTADGETLVDCTMALGAVAIGYAEPNITRAVVDAASSGNVAGLSSTMEIDLAERFCGMVPCAEKVQFLKTGAEAVAAAVRLARTYTARDVVIGSGYFGWLDWCSSASGVPKGVSQDFVAVPFDDVPALEAAASAAGPRLAAIVIEPVVERLASKAWVERARALCDAAGAVLVFDEMKTGFRLAPGGYQEYAEITPDLATFGKAMANGYPLSAVCGKADVMDAARRTWISSTLASEATALAAAIMVNEIHQTSEVCPELWRIGKETRSVVQTALTASGLEGVAIEGIDPMWLLRFTSPAAETLFVRTAAAHGALFKRGAYNFAALAHDEAAILEIEEAASNAFVAVRRELTGS